MADNNGIPETIIEQDHIEQDHKRGPGLFLIISYVVIAAFCVYYLFTQWDWKSDYDLQQEEIRAEIDQSGE